jgi:hypothetical protein
VVQVAAVETITMLQVAAAQAATVVMFQVNLLEEEDQLKAYLLELLQQITL